MIISLRKGRLELVIFFMLFITYSYFHQGGGWNQNGRFAQVRSIVETGQFEINNYVIYRFVPDSDEKTRLRRLPLPPGLQLEQIALNASTGDVSLFEGRLYPNKPPGAVLTAVPIYFAIYWVERALGIDPDDWWPLTINAYLTTVFSVSLLIALGGLAFYRISLRLFPLASTWTHVASTLTFGIGTLMLPFATMLYDHDIVAALCLFGFWLLLVEKDSEFTSLHSAIILVTAGMLVGSTVIANYSSIISVIFLTIYVLWTARPRWKVIFFVGGLMLPLTALGWYHRACFGSVLANAGTYQYEIFQGEKMLLLDMFSVPQFDVLLKLLFSSYRGLFFTSPVLILSCLGLWQMAIRGGMRVGAVLFVAIFTGFLVMNSAVNHWHSGWSIGPRYLIPALPFLSLPLPLVFERLPRTTLAVAAVSAVVMLLATAVDPQPPTGIQNPLIEYVLPLLQGKTMMFSGLGRAHPLMQGPVSANPLGIYESWLYPIFHPGIIQRQWNSFNLGEFIWPASLLSLLPLLSVLILGLGILWYWCRRSITQSRKLFIVAR